MNLRHGGLMRIINWQVLLGLVLIGLSAIVLYIHFLIFHNAHDIFFYLLIDIGFVFIEVLLVTIILHRVLNYREKKNMLQKLNMVIGAFFSEVGVKLLRSLAAFDTASADIAEQLVMRDNWSEANFLTLRRKILRYRCQIEPSEGDMAELKDFLTRHRHALLDLLRNANLLEHESFTNLLWAVFHLSEELHYRPSLEALPENDLKHLGKDIERAYILLLLEWVTYMKHLKRDYPYLFSLAKRTNPFDAEAAVVIR